jgi:ATP/maltotriose-dependent transcriptional regulator MalT
VLFRSGLPLQRDGSSADAPALHPFVRDVLQHDLRRDRPGAEPAIHRRVATWARKSGDVDRAAAHALAASDWAVVGEVLLDLLPAAAWDGRAARVEAWLGSIPPTVARDSPTLRLAAATTELARGNMTRAAALVAPARSGTGAQVVAAFGSGDPSQVRRAAARAATECPVDSPWQPLAAFAEGAAAGVSGDLTAARDALERGARHAHATSPVLAALCEAQLGVLLMLAGAWDDGSELANRARNRLACARVAPTVGAMIVPAAAALARTHAGRFDEAHIDLALVRSLRSRPTDLPIWWEIGRAHV